MDTAIFKCRKCRRFLFTSEKIASSHEKTNENCQDLEKDKYVWFLRDDNLEEWMELQLNQGNWIKGKVFCPLCNGRIGSYDFVSGAQCSCGNVLPAIHIVKSKVDYEQKSEIDGIREKIHKPPTISKTDELCLEGETTTTVKPLLMCNKTVLEHSQPTLLTKQEAEETNNIATEERCHIPSEGPSGFKSENINKNYDFIKERKQKKLKVQKCSKVSISQKMYVQGKSNKEMPQLSPDKSKALWNSLTCAVCLDIYFSPFICRPCGHTFCESCLRVIAKPNPTKTCCPLCRQPIGCCELNRDVSKQAMISFPLEYNNRLQENRYEVENLPLPWTPHYHFRNFTSLGRNLLINRPETGVRNIWTTFCLSLPTIAILIFLNIFSIAMFLLSYFGCSYIPTVMTYLSSLIWQILTSHVSTKSNETYEFKGLHGAIATVFILIGFTVIVTIIVYFKLRSLLTREH